MVAGDAISTGKVNWLALLTSAIYIVIGGIVTMTLEPTTVFQAFAFGAGWQAIFTNIVGTRPQDGG